MIARAAWVFGFILAGSPVLASAPAPAPGPTFRHLQVADGLSDSHVQALWQDRQGFIWIGTADGFNRYDGYGFRVFRHIEDDPRSLGPGIPRSIAEDGAGRLWIALSGGGLSVYDPRAEDFAHFRHDPADPQSLGNDFAETVMVDREGAVWVGTNGGGLDRIDPRTQRVAHFRHDPADPSSLAQDTISALFQDRSGVVWVGTSESGLERVVPGAGGALRFEHFRHRSADAASLSSDRIDSILETSDGSLWIGTWDGGLNRIDAGRSAVTRVKNAPGARRVKSLVQDRSGALWLGTWGAGVGRLDPASGRFEAFPPRPTQPGGLSHANTNALLVDRGGMLWIGTGGGGVNVADLEAKAFARYPSAAEEPGGLSGTDIRAVLVDRDGGVWVGTAGAGLDHIERPGGRVVHYRHDPAVPASLADDNVWSLLEDRAGNVWVGTYGAGLDRLDRATGRFEHHAHDAGQPGSLSEDTVYALHEDAAGRLWAGTWDGLNLLDRSTGRFRVFRSGRAEQQSVQFITGDPSGFLWLGLGPQLVRFHPDTGAFEPVVVDARHPDRLGVGLLWCLKRDASGRTWVGTSEGLVELVLGGAAPALRRFGARQGLPGALVDSIEESEGQLWLGTTQGLVRFDPRLETGRRYDASDGLPDVTFNPASSWAAGGELFFGATGGLTSFRPGEIEDDGPPPRVTLTGLRLSHEPVAVGPDSVLRSALSATDAIELPREGLSLTLEFATLSFRSTSRHRFRYHLDGFDREWQEIGGGEHSATYTSLRPGRYRFHVLGSNGDGVWGKEAASIEFWIRPPWWATWWFRVLAVLAVAGLLVAIHRLRTKVIAARNRRLEEEVQMRQRAHEAAIQSEHQIRLMADALPVIIAYVDADCRIRFMNQAGEEWSGIPRAALEGRAVQEILPPAMESYVSEQLQAALSGKRVAFELNVGELGTRQRIAVTLIPHSEAGGRTGFYGLAQDITDRVRTQEELHRRQDQIAHASRVSTLGEMASALAHELNQPLTAVLANAHAVLRLQAAANGDWSLPEDVDESLRDIAQDAARAGEIIRRMRDLIRKDASRRVPIDVNEAIRGVDTLMHAVALESDVSLHLDLAPALPLTSGDTIQLQQVVLNLVRNGIEAMSTLPKGERRLQVRSRHEGGAIVVTIEDSGPALPHETLQGLFVPFYTTKVNGLGMGLSISRSIIEAHGGAIEALRGDQRGLCVRFTLPAGMEAKRPVSVAEPAGS